MKLIQVIRKSREETLSRKFDQELGLMVIFYQAKAKKMKKFKTFAS